MGKDKKDKQVILISENEELYKSLKRAFKFLEGIDVTRMTPTDILSFIEDDSILLFEGLREDNFYSFRNDIRFRRRLLNPLAAFCYEPLKNFDKKNDNHHYYFYVPFDLKDVTKTVKNLLPISSSQKLLEYFPVWLKDDDHTIQNWLLTSGKPMEVINFIKDLLEVFNPPESIKDKGKSILNLLKEESWQKNAFNITKSLCDFLNDLYKEELNMKGNILVVDDEITEKSLLWNFFKELAAELGYEVIFIQKPEEVGNKITRDTKFAFLDVEFKKYKPDTVNKLREKIKPIPYIIFSKYPQKPLQRLDITIQKSVEQLLKALKPFKNTSILADIKYTTDYIGRLEKKELLEEIEEDIGKYKKETEIIKLLNFLKEAIKSKYPVDLYPEIKRCVAYVEKKDLEREKSFIKQLIESAVKSSNEGYGLDITMQNKIIKVIDQKSKMEICDVSLNQNEWVFFNKCYVVYPNAADFKNELNSLPKEKKTKFYDIKYQIEKNIKEKSKGRVISIFERVGKGLFKLSIKPHKHEITTATPYTKEIEFVTRKEFNELKEKVEKILSILKKQQP